MDKSGKHSPLTTEKNAIKIRLLVDRASVEVLANDGEIMMPGCFNDGDRRLKMFATAGSARFASLKAYKLKSIWPDASA